MRRTGLLLVVLALVAACAKKEPVNPAPALVVNETYNWDGNLDLANFQGKVVVLDFWTYW